ncbi:NAD(P)-dependent oxidoreductase [Gammaproteobacteria bacterium]|nr:NAD(P)-dependent oxidoreductase [Gammaproteobacteria bacterium]
MNILITGANGYLAKNLVKELVGKTKHKLTLLVRKNSDVDELLNHVSIENIIFYDGSIGSLNNLQNYKIDLVFHLANYYPDTIKPAMPEEIISSNLTLISNVITSLGDNIDKVQRELNYRIINVSSYVIHDSDTDSLYKHTKKCAFNYLRNRNCKNYLLFDTYGGNDPRPKLMNCLINYSKAGKTLEMKCSKYSQINLVYIKDVISAFMTVIEKKGEEDLYEIRCDTLTLEEVVKTFNEVSENKVKVIWHEYSPTNYISETEIIKTPEDWKPRYNLIMGLTEMLKL